MRAWRRVLRVVGEQLAAHCMGRARGDPHEGAVVVDRAAAVLARDDDRRDAGALRRAVPAPPRDPLTQLRTIGEVTAALMASEGQQQQKQQRQPS